MAQFSVIAIVIWLLLFVSNSVSIVFRERTFPSLNDPCQVARTRSTGRCCFIENCPIVREEILKHGTFPQLCGFQDNKELICCPKKVEDLKPNVRISQKSEFFSDVFMINFDCMINFI